jgi:hypothetical protein
MSGSGKIAYIASPRGEAEHYGQHSEAGPDGGGCEGDEHRHDPLYSKLILFVRNIVMAASIRLTTIARARLLVLGRDCSGERLRADALQRPISAEDRRCHAATDEKHA